ncbi:serine protease-like protein [Leptotrombidium deliense]|uniref:Serine protease-like protein n=1 Tax=Leptotrombidium deliense TaxID=299467 RepID=A0A443SS17_9ACAR|nr:serine protease-like protein [Leptotrombidium deliense]
MLKLFFIALCVTYVYAQYECGKSFPPKRRSGEIVSGYRSYAVVVPVKIIIHSSSRSTSDIALIKVTPPFLFKQGDDDEGAVNRVCLPTDEQQFTGKVTISGWGSTKEEDNNNNATIHRELFAANVPLIDDLVCQQYSNIFSPGPYTCAGPSNKRSRQGGCYVRLFCNVKV